MQNPSPAIALGLAAAWTAATGCTPDENQPPRAPEYAVLALLTETDTDAPARAGLIELGRASFEEMGCGLCHRFDAAPATGPRLDGLTGSVVRVSDPAAPGGVRELTADRAWLWESIVHSQRSHVKGFENVTRMTPYAHVLDTDEVAGIIAWLETK